MEDFVIKSECKNRFYCLVEYVVSLLFADLFFLFLFSFQNQSMIGQQIRQITPNQSYTSMQTSQVSLFCHFFCFAKAVFPMQELSPRTL